MEVTVLVSPLFDRVASRVRLVPTTLDTGNAKDVRIGYVAGQLRDSKRRGNFYRFVWLAEFRHGHRLPFYDSREIQ